jgi:hypothetical protein
LMLLILTGTTAVSLSHLLVGLKGANLCENSVRGEAHSVFGHCCLIDTKLTMQRVSGSRHQGMPPSSYLQCDKR